MKRVVLDASVALAWFLDSPVDAMAIRVRNSLENGSQALVPALWRLEVASGFAIAERRRALPSSFADRCLSDIEVLTDSVIETSPIAISLRQALSVARTFRLSAYGSLSGNGPCRKSSLGDS